jgi:hypothetical protein
MRYMNLSPSSNLVNYNKILIMSFPKKHFQFMYAARLSIIDCRNKLLKWVSSTNTQHTLNNHLNEFSSENF